MRNSSITRILILLSLLLARVNGYDQNSIIGFYIAPVWYSFSNPIFTNQGMGTWENPNELYIPKTASGWRIQSGAECLFFGDRNEMGGGFGLGLTMWSTTFDDFRYPLFPEDDEMIYYSNPTLLYFFLDLNFYLFLPIEKIPVAIFATIGMGSETEKVSLSDDLSIYEHNEQYKESEFDYSWGLGIRVFILPRLSMYSEYRWIPGVKSGPIYPMEGDWYYYYESEQKIKNKSKVLSIGIIYTFLKI